MKTALALVCLLAVGGVGTATASTTNSPQDKKIGALERQVKTLKADNKKLRAQNATLQGQLASVTNSLKTATTALGQAKIDLEAKASALAAAISERDTLKGQLAAAQASAGGAVRTMAASAVWTNVLPAVAAVFNGGQWKTDTYSSGDYQSYTFTWCGFC